MTFAAQPDRPAPVGRASTPRGRDPLARATLLAATIALAACAPAQHEWVIILPDGPERVTRVEFEIRPGFCSSDAEPVYRGSVAPGEATTMPPRLGDGPFAIEVRAWVAGCFVYASTCDDVALPLDQPIVSRLERIPGYNACEEEESCEAGGRCARLECVLGNDTACGMGAEFSCVDGSIDITRLPRACMFGCDGLRCAPYQPLHWTPEVGYPDTLALSAIGGELRLSWREGGDGNGLFECDEGSCVRVHDLEPGLQSGVAVVMATESGQRHLWVMVDRFALGTTLVSESEIPVIIWSRSPAQLSIFALGLVGEPTEPADPSGGGAGGSAHGRGGAGGPGADGVADASALVSPERPVFSVGEPGRGPGGGRPGGAVQLVAPGIDLALALVPGLGGAGGARSGGGGGGGGGGGSLVLDSGAHSCAVGSDVQAGGGGGGAGGGAASTGSPGSPSPGDTMRMSAGGPSDGEGGEGGAGSDMDGIAADGAAPVVAGSGGGGGGGGGGVVVIRSGAAVSVQVAGATLITMDAR